MCTAFFGMVACTGLEPYKIEAPGDLSEKIAEYQAEKEAKEESGEVVVTITEIPTAPFFSAFSQEFVIPVGKLLELKFINHTPKIENWNNWNLSVIKDQDGKRTWDTFADYGYFTLRADGWVMKKIDEADGGQRVVLEYPDWDTFKQKMDEAEVVLRIDHSPTGNCFVTAVATATDGTEMTMTYNNPVSAVENIRAFVFGDNSGLTITGAAMEETEVKEIEDVKPASIKVSGFPATVKLGTTLEEILEGATLTATVTFEDEEVKTVNIEDVQFFVDEKFASAPGTDVILYTYALSKQGNVVPAVAGSSKVTITTDMTGITASAKAYVIGNARYITLSPSAITVEGVYSGGSTLPISSSDCTVSFTEDKVVYDAVPGTYANAFTVTYGSGADAMTATGDLVIAASSLPAQEENVGAKDFSNGWWSTFTRDWVVAPGESQTIGFTLYSKGTANYQSPCTILRRADLSEYGVVRMDHWCWGAATGDTDPASANSPARIDITSDWNFEGTYFAQHLNGSTVNITVANDGTYASISYYVIYPDGEETHFQRYDKIPVDANDVQFALVTEASYLEFVADAPIDPSDPTVKSIAVTKAPTVSTYYVYDKAVPFKPVDVEITATYSDNSQKVLDNSTLTFSNIPAEAGSKQITVTYNESINTTIDITVVKGTSAFGVPDFSSGWWTVFSEYYTVASGESKTIGMMMYSADDAVFKAPVVVLSNFERGAEGYAEFVAARIDNFGWGTSYDACQKSNNWPLDGNNVPDLVGKMWGTQLTVTITNNGDNTAKIRYDLTMRNGLSYYQLYEGIAISGDSIKAFMVPDGCYLVTL